MNRWWKRKELRLKNSDFFSVRSAARQVFYPGCSLPGADPDFCLQVYQELQAKIPGVGIWFDCCAKPLRMRRDHRGAEKEEQRLLKEMLDAGVEEVITACGNCYLQFDSFVDGRLKVRSLYDLLDLPEIGPDAGETIIHHPCCARQDSRLQEGVFRLADASGLSLKNRNQQGHPLACCLHDNKSSRQRKAALRGESLVTYCAHCVVKFQDEIPSRHLLQVLYGSTRQWRETGKYGLFANYRKFCKLLRKHGLVS